MKRRNQIETHLKNKVGIGALLILLTVNTGCRLVDGQDPGVESLVLNSMAISSSCSSEVAAAEAYSCKPDVSISDAIDASELTWELTEQNTCDWLQINPTTGQVFGTPGREHIGSCVLALRIVTLQSAPQSDFVQPLTVTGPKINFIDSNCQLTAPVDALYKCPIKTTTALSPATITYSLASDNQCAWAGVDANTGVVSGTPSLSQVGSCRLSVQASIDSIATAVTRMTIGVPSVPVTVAASCPTNAEPGVSYSCKPTASAPVTTPQFTWSLSPTNTCTWASINATTGIVSGSPLVQSVGSCRLDFRAKLPNGSYGQTYLTVRISPKGYNEIALSDLNPGLQDDAGKSVAIDGNFAVIGMPYASDGAGAVAVYRFDGSNWRKHAVFASPDSKKIQGFGYSVSISGNSILVGAPDSSVNSYHEGAIVAFEWNGSSWAQTQILMPSSPADRMLMNFGSSVALDGARAVVGSSHYNAAAAYVLAKSGSTWVVQSTLDFNAVNAANIGDRVKVALQGSTAVVSDNFAGNSHDGEVHIFRLVNGSWIESGVLLGTSSAKFGASVDTYGGKVLIGSPGERSSTGAAYLYEAGQSAWIQTAAFRAVDETAGRKCGASVSLKSAQAVVGCASASGPGSIYLYTQASSVWGLTTKIISSNGQTSDNFGAAVGLSGTNLIVGADLYDAGATDTGAAWIFRAK